MLEKYPYMNEYWEDKRAKIENIDVLQAKSPIKIAVKAGAKFVQKFSFENDIVYLIISVAITFLMLYSIVKLLKSLVLKKIEGFFDQYIFSQNLISMRGSAMKRLGEVVLRLGVQLERWTGQLLCFLGFCFGRFGEKPSGQPNHAWKDDAPTRFPRNSVCACNSL